MESVFKVGNRTHELSKRCKSFIANAKKDGWDLSSIATKYDHRSQKIKYFEVSLTRENLTIHYDDLAECVSLSALVPDMSTKQPRIVALAAQNHLMSKWSVFSEFLNSLSHG